MKIIKYNYEPELKKAFIEMNEFWIKKDFFLEDEDRRVFSKIDEYVRNGANIYFALYDELPISTVCITPIGNGTFELIKFATKDGYYNLGAGKKVLDYALHDAKNYAKKIIIATNKKCKSAIHLYEKYGFKIIESEDLFGFSNDRVDICFEKEII